MDFKIKEQSFIARIAAWKLKERNMAIVLGKTIFLHGVSADDFKNNSTWLKHEQEHIRQFKQYGFFSFIYKYLLESLKNGYHNNKFEVAAREAEQK